MIDRHLACDADQRVVYSIHNATEIVEERARKCVWKELRTMPGNKGERSYPRSQRETAVRAERDVPFRRRVRLVPGKGVSWSRILASQGPESRTLTTRVWLEREKGGSWTVGQGFPSIP